MTVFRAEGDDRAATLARRLADRGIGSGLLTPEAAGLLQEAFGSDPDAMRDALEEAFAVAVGEGALRVDARHAAQAIGLVSSAAPEEAEPPAFVASPAAPIVEARFIRTWRVDAQVAKAPSRAAPPPPPPATQAPLSYARPRPAAAVAPVQPAAGPAFPFARARPAAAERSPLEAAGPRPPASEDPSEYRPRARHMAAAAMIAVLAGGGPFAVRAWEGGAEPIAVETIRPGSAPAARPAPKSMVAVVAVPAPPIAAPARVFVAPPPPSEPPDAKAERAPHPEVADVAAPAPGSPRLPPETAAAPSEKPAIPAPWAGVPVAVPPRVVVEYPNGEPRSEAEAMRVAATLRGKGVTVVGVSASRARQGAGITYGFAEDRGTAESLASMLGGPWQAREQPARTGDQDLPEPGTVRLSLQ